MSHESWARFASLASAVALVNSLGSEHSRGTPTVTTAPLNSVNNRKKLKSHSKHVCDNDLRTQAPTRKTATAQQKIPRSSIKPQSCASVRKRAEACGSVRKRAEACGSVRKRAGGILRFCADWLANGLSESFLSPAVPGVTLAKNRCAKLFSRSHAAGFGIPGLVVIFGAGQRPSLCVSTQRARKLRPTIPSSPRSPTAKQTLYPQRPSPTCLA